MTTWMIEGEWSGPVSPAGSWTRIVHREFTRSRKRVDKCRALGVITFTDHTTMALRAYERQGSGCRGGKRPPTIPGYHDLINICLQTGLTSVEELYEKGLLR